MSDLRHAAIDEERDWRVAIRTGGKWLDLTDYSYSIIIRITRRKRQNPDAAQDMH